MMIPVLALACFAAGSVSGALQPIAPASFEVFLQIFRQTLLEKVALEVNNTVDMSSELNTTVETCKPLIAAKVTQCKACAKSKCQTSPSFTDILNLANPYTYLKGPLDDIGSKVGDAVDLIGDKAGGFINSMKNLGASVKVPPEFKFIYNQIKIGISKAISSLKSLGKDIGNFVIDTGSIIGDGFNKLKDILGKKRRKREVIDPKVKQCMQQCSSCAPLLLPTESETITAVCGPEIAQTNTTIQNRLQKIQSVYDYALDKVNTIVKKMEVDFASASGADLTNVQLTVFLNGAYTTYKTEVPVSMLDMVVGPARNMAMEFWGKFSA